MRRLWKRLEAAFAAAAFAEEGDAETARRLVAEAERDARAPASLESTLAAAAFAEEGDAETARLMVAEVAPTTAPAATKDAPAPTPLRPAAEPPAASGRARGA